MEKAACLPVSVMGDAAGAITLAVKNMVPGKNRLTCYAHVMENTSKKLAPVRALDPEITRRIQDDIRFIQAGSLDENMFLLLMALFQKKWTSMEYSNTELKNRVFAFMAYFLKVWGRNSDTRKWFQGANPQSASTNNANEALTMFSSVILVSGNGSLFRCSLTN